MSTDQQTTNNEEYCQECGQISSNGTFCSNKCRREYFEDDSCERCGCCGTDWEVCDYCGGDGGRDGFDLMDEDPFWYGPDDYEVCRNCQGKGGFTICIGGCNENGEHKPIKN